MKGFTLLLKRGVLSALLLWFATPLCAQQIVTAIHVQWDSNLTDGEVANPCFYFLVAYKFPIINVTEDWAELQDLTQVHSTQPVRQTSFSVQSGLHPGCTQPPVSDPQNWSLRSCGMFPMMGTLLHNAPYRVTVQYCYLAIVGYNPMPIYQTFGPYQTSMEFSVRNLVVSSADEVKVLKWDPDRPEVCDTSFQYTLDSAQTRDVPVRISIYSTDGSKVFEVTEQKRCPLTRTFTWNGRNSLDQPAPPGLYVFDVEANPNAGSSGDTDRLRSSRISVGEHEADIIASEVVEAKYVLYSGIDAFAAWVTAYDPDLNLLSAPIPGPNRAIPMGNFPTEEDWNTIRFRASLQYAGAPYRFVFWARDNYIHLDKAHRHKTCLVNESVIILGWALSAGFVYSKEPGLPWSICGLDVVDTREIAEEVVTAVSNVGITAANNTLRIGKYLHWVSLSNIGQANLLYTMPEGADRFVELLRCAVASGAPGVVHWAGHSGAGERLAFPDDDPTQPDYFFEIADVAPLPQMSRVKVVYLGGCHTCLDVNGAGLPAAFVRKGVHAAVGWHDKIVWGRAKKQRVHQVFWERLAGITVKEKRIDKREPGGTVLQAVKAAAKAYKLTFEIFAGWESFFGIAGNRLEKLY